MIQAYIGIGCAIALFFFYDLQKSFPDKYPVGNLLIAVIVGAFWPIYLLQLLLETRRD